MFGLGMPELLVILAIILLIFGADKIPGLGKAIGKAISEFKSGTKAADAQAKEIEANLKNDEDAAKKN